MDNGNSDNNLDKKEDDASFSLENLEKILNENSNSNLTEKVSENAFFDEFLMKYGSTYEFKEPQFERFSLLLLKHRIQNQEWRANATRIDILRATRMVRVLSRDIDLLKIMISTEINENLFLNDITEQFNEATLTFFKSPEKVLMKEIILELDSIIRRCMKLPTTMLKLIYKNHHNDLILLLSSDNVDLVKISLHRLISFCKEGSEFCSDMEKTNIMNFLLKIISGSSFISPICSSLAWDLLGYLVQHRKMMKEFCSLGGCKLSIIQLCKPYKSRENSDEEQSQSEFVIEHILGFLLFAVSEYPEFSKQVLKYNGIEGLLQILDSQGSNDSSASLIIVICDILSRLCLNEQCSLQIKHLNGIPTIGNLLLFPNFEVVAFVLRLLRFIYSNEDTRNFLKLSFPYKVFGKFVDIGQYVFPVEKYYVLASEIWNDRKLLSSIVTGFNSIESNTEEKKRTIGQYNVIREIGEGSFGKVYLVQKSSPDSLFAIKELTIKGGKIANEEEEFEKPPSQVENEINILSEMEHPNIVRYHSSFVEKDFFYIVMEYVNGRSLSLWLKSLKEKGQNLPETKIWAIFIQLALALNYLHVEKKIIHRDLHPSNVLIDDNERIKIADFGLARKKKTNENTLKSNSVVGMIAYSCPEMMKNKQYDYGADIWSAGCILYQLATLKPPFPYQNDTVLNIARKIVSGKYEPIPVVYTPLLRGLVRLMLTGDPSKRPNILKISAQISPLFMVELDRLYQNKYKLESDLLEEEKTRKRDKKEIASLKAELSEYKSRSPLQDEGKLQMNGSTKLFSHSRLRAIENPYIERMYLLEKIIFIDQLPPNVTKDWRKEVVSRYKRELFCKDRKLIPEQELSKLASRSTFIIDVEFLESNHRSLSYSQLSAIIEEVATEYGYKGWKTNNDLASPYVSNRMVKLSDKRMSDTSELEFNQQRRQNNPNSPNNDQAQKIQNTLLQADIEIQKK